MATALSCFRVWSFSRRQQQRQQVARFVRSTAAMARGSSSTAAAAAEGAEDSKLREFFVFNTMTRQKELFRPKVDGKVGMYVCGVTAYDYSHIGHARVYVSFDLLHRFLKYMGYDVTYVRNFTDIDDKIIKRANELGEDPIKLSHRFCDEFHVDMELLRCLPPSIEPRVSGHIDNIVQMIAKILENGYGYVLECGDVYFSLDDFVSKFPDYGRLSDRTLDDNRAGERVAVDERKRNPGDFVLWKSSKPGEPAWESPWGPGRPGWHIECSAMSDATLGHSFDIHGGGMDLIFPHHENEIAQSRAACEHSNVSYWMHNGFVTMNSIKMSKSVGNFSTIRNALKLYHPLAMRWFLLSTHYRSAINYSKDHLELASDRVYYLYQTMLDMELCMAQDTADGKDGTKASKQALQCASAFKQEFFASLADDLHAPINSLTEPLKMLNELINKGRKDKSRLASSLVLKGCVEEVLNVLGLAVESYEEALQGLKEKALQRAGLTEEDVLAKIKERVEARRLKEYARSDEIRSQLSTLGISLMDIGADIVWRPAAVVTEPKKKEASTEV